MKTVNNIAEIVEVCYTAGYERAKEQLSNSTERDIRDRAFEDCRKEIYNELYDVKYDKTLNEVVNRLNTAFEKLFLECGVSDNPHQE